MISCDWQEAVFPSFGPLSSPSLHLSSSDTQSVCRWERENIIVIGSQLVYADHRLAPRTTLHKVLSFTVSISRLQRHTFGSCVLFTTAVFTLSFLHAGLGFFSPYTQRTATLFSLHYFFSHTWWIFELLTLFFSTYLVNFWTPHTIFFHIPGEFLNSSLKILKLQLFLSGNFSSSLFTHQLLLVDFCCVVNIAGDVIAGNPCIYIAVVLLKVHSSSLVP